MRVVTVAGLLLLIATAAVYLVLAFVVRRTYPTWWFDGVVVIGMALAMVGWMVDRQTWITLLTVVLGVVWFALTRRELGISGSERLSVSVGDAVPAFRVVTADGAVFTERELVDTAPALLVLYRGWWCPYCTTQLDELQREHDAFDAAGIRVFAVSVDSPADTAALQGRFGETITFLSDTSGVLLDTIGVRDAKGAAWYDRLLYGVAKGDISLPAVILIDRDGSIRYTYRSPRIDIRPSPQEIISA